MAAKKTCGAKTRAGSPCSNGPMKNGRCRLHGGMSPGAPKGNKNNLKHGIYSKLYPNFQLDEAIAMQGTVRRELAIARIQLSRLLEYRQTIGDTPTLDEIEDVSIAQEEDEDTVKKARAADAMRCGEYYDPDDDDDGVRRQESDPLKRKRVYRTRDWATEESRLINLIAKLEIQSVKQEHAILDLEDRRKELDDKARNKGKGLTVEEMTNEQLDDELARMLNR